MRKLYFPEIFIEFPLNKKLSALEMQKIKSGLQPSHMDNKWIIYFEDPWLFFHRTLTGNCIFKIHIICKDFNCEIDSINVNGDPEQYKISDDEKVEDFLEIFKYFIEAKLGGSYG